MAEQAGGAQGTAPGDLSAGRSEHADQTALAIPGGIPWLMSRSPEIARVPPPAALDLA
ncbi:hypothetical protein AB4099_26675 [Bosea sp. 2KB_26]|uniref:hypothetical protein n=1 Tax=Bosea sp. 2KB_26 TaxID=3237475 RepID=UPI003F8DDA49